MPEYYEHSQNINSKLKGLCTYHLLYYPNNLQCYYVAIKLVNMW
jgi:hypothetical protein